MINFIRTPRTCLVLVIIHEFRRMKNEISISPRFVNISSLEKPAGDDFLETKMRGFFFFFFLGQAEMQREREFLREMNRITIGIIHYA